MELTLDNVVQEKDGRLSVYVKLSPDAQSICVQGKDLAEIKDRLRPKIEAARSKEDAAAALRQQAQTAIDELQAEITRGGIDGADMDR